MAGIAYLNRVRKQSPPRPRSFAIESLENRVLPSGVSPFPVKKASFLDADGDKVKVKMKGDLFSISLLGGADNNADIDTITILPGKLGIFDPKASLSIKVKGGKTGDDITEIAHINLADDPRLTERFGKMEFTNVVLNNMNLFGDLTTLSAKNTDFGNVEISGALASMIIGNHDLTGTISAHSIGTITNVGPLSAGDIAGNVISETTIAKVLTNRITGSVTAGGAISILATAEDLDGSVEANGGTLTAVIGRDLDGSITVHGGNLSMGTLTAVGVKGDVTGTVVVDGLLITGLLPSLSINAGGDFTPGASILCDGNLTAKANEIQTDLTSTSGDVTFAMKSGGLGTTISAGDDVFGDGTNGAIVIRGDNLSGQIRAIGDISAVTLNPTTLGITGSLIAGGNVGDITAHFFNGAVVIAGDQTGTGSIGNILVEHDDLDGGISSAIFNSNVTAATDIGTITVEQHGGEHGIEQSSFEATNGAVGALTVSTTGTGSAILGLALARTFTAGTTFGAIDATSDSAAAILDTQFQADGNFDIITATSNSADGFLSSAFVSTGGSMGAITGSSSSADGIDDTTFDAAAGIASITGVSSTATGINASTFRTTTGAIGSIVGSSTDSTSTADAILNSNFTSGGTTGAILGDAQLGTGISSSTFSSEGSIDSITGVTTNSDTAINKDGIQHSVFRSHGSIGKISATTQVEDSGLAGATESEAIDDSMFSAFGDIAAATGNAIETSGDIQTSFFLAGYDIGGNVKLDGLAGPGGDDIKGNPIAPVRIGDISVGSDIVASFFASGVGTDNTIVGDNTVGSLDDFMNAPGSSIGNVTVEGVITGANVGPSGAILGTGGYNSSPLSNFSSDAIGVIDADAIGMSDESNNEVSSVGISAEFGLVAFGSIEGITAHTSTRAQAIGDGILVTTTSSVGFLTAINDGENAVSAIGTGFFGSNHLINGFIGEITADASNSPGAVAIDGRGTFGGSGVTFTYNTDNSSTGVSIGNINATVANLTGEVAIENATFNSLFITNMGTITTRGNIEDSTFNAEVNLADITGGTGITVQGNIEHSNFSAGFFGGDGAMATNGGINVSPLAGEEGFIDGCEFTATINNGATLLAIGNITVSGTDVDGIAIGATSFEAIPNTFPPPPIHIGVITLATGSLEDSTFTASGDIALAGKISVFGNSVHKDFGISNCTFEAGGAIGSIEVGPSGLAKETVGTEVRHSNFTAVGDIAVATGIVIHGNNTGGVADRSNGAEAGLSFFDAHFRAINPDDPIPPSPGKSSIGDILIGQSTGDLSGGGIESSSFDADKDLGDIRVRINVTDATEDVSAISNSQFEAQSIVQVNDIPTEAGHIRNIEAIVTGLPSTKDVITNSTFDSGRDGLLFDSALSIDSFGDITASTEGTGLAVTGSTFRTAAKMGSINLRSGSVSNDAVFDSIFSAYASIGSGFGNEIEIIGNVTECKFLSGYDIGTELVFGNGDHLNPQNNNDEEVEINRVNINGNLIASDIIAGINPGQGSIFGDTTPLVPNGDGTLPPPAPSDDFVAAHASKIGTVQVNGGIFTQGPDQKQHGIEAGRIGEFQQPAGTSHNSELPGFLDNGGGALDVKLQGAPSGAPVFLTSRDFGGREVDFNHDGRTDVIMLDARSNALDIFFGNGDGTFSDPTILSTGTAPVAAVIGNFNGDHVVDANGNDIFDGDGNLIPVLDIVVLNSLSDTRQGFVGSNTIDIFFGDDVSGEFTAANHNTQSLGFGSRTLTSMTVSDWFDTTTTNSAQGDGFLDLVITNETNDNARLLKNNGSGTFTSTTVNNPFATGADPTGATATPPLSTIAPDPAASGAIDYGIDPGRDIDGPVLSLNGPDLVVANRGGGTVSVFLGNSAGTGSGQFSAPTNYTVGTTPIATILGDVDNDGDVDILVANFGSDNVTVLFNNGVGLFTTSTTIVVGDQPRGIIVGDFNGDGKLDFATANADEGTNDVSVVLNSVGGNFAGAVAANVDIEGLPLSITSADYNGDGDVDLAVTDADDATSPVVLLNGVGVNPVGTFSVLTVP